MSKAIIDFGSGDTSPLKDISDMLQTIIDKEGAVGQAWKETSDQMNTQGKANVDQTNKLAQSIDQVATSTKKLPESIIGGAYANSIKELTAQISQWVTMGTDGSKKISAQIDVLIGKENILKEAIANASNPELIQQYQTGLKQTQEQINLLGVALDGLQSSGHVFDEFKTSADQVVEKTQTISTLINKTINDLAKSGGANTGGTALKSLQDIQSQYQLTNAQVLQYLQNTKKAAQSALVSSTDTAAIAGYKQTIALTNDQINTFTQAQKQTRLEGANFTTQIRSIRNELLSMTEAGQSGTAEFEALKNKYAEIQRISKQFNIQSQGLVQNNEVIAGTISLLSGVTGAYQVATSAQLLFGDANEDVQKAMQKLFAIMNLVQGLQQLTAVIQKSSAASILLESIARKANTAAIAENNAATEVNVASTEADIATTEADSAAKVIQTGVTEGATAATLELNAALLDNPVTLVIVGVLALISAISALNSANHSAQEIQDEVNQSLEDATVLLDADAKSIENYTKVAIANAKLRGASAVEISKIQGDANIQELANIREQSDALGKKYNNEIDFFNKVFEAGGKIDKETLDAHAKLLDEKNKLDAEYADKSKALQTEILEHQKLINDENFKSYNAYIQTQVAAQTAGTDAERNAQIAAIKEIAAARESDANFQTLTAGEKALTRANDEKQIQALQLQNFQHYLKGRTASVDAELAIQKALQATSDADQIATINKITDLQIASIKKQRDETLSNPALNAGERQKAIDEANAAIVEAEKKKQADILNVQKAELTLQLAAAQKGSYDEYVYNLALLKNSEDQELLSAGKNQDLIKAIKDKYRKLDQDADTAYNVIQLNNDISRDDAALARFGINEQDKLGITIKRLDDQQAIEILQANDNAAKIAEIDAKYDQQRRDAVKASIEAQLALDLNALAVYGQKAKSLNELILNNPTSPEGSKLVANNSLQIQAQQEIDIQKAAAEEEFNNKVITYKQYLLKLEELKNQEDVINQTHADNELKIFKDTQDKKLALLQNTLNILQASVDTMDTSAMKTGLTQVLGLFTQIGTAINSNAAAQKAADLESDPTKKAALQAAADQQKLENTQKTISAGILATQATINQVFSDASAQRQQQMADDLQALENQKNVELNNANLTAKQKDEINARYAAKEKQVRLQEWKAEQEAKKEQAIINGALAITNIIATVPKFDFGVSTAIMIAAAVASTALQVAEIEKVKPPKFRHGKIDIQGPGTSTSDSIPSLISRGESVVNAESTAKWKEALVAINDNHFEDYLSQKFKSFVFPHIPDNVAIPSSQQKEIDYDLLATTMATKMKGVIPAPKSMHFNIDKNGIRTIVKEGNTTTEWKNKRYSMQG